MNPNLLLFLCIVHTFASEDISQFSEIMRTTIRAIGKPTRVTALVCWDTGREFASFLQNILFNCHCLVRQLLDINFTVNSIPLPTPIMISHLDWLRSIARTYRKRSMNTRNLYFWTPVATA